VQPIEFGTYLKKCRKSKKLTIRQLDLYSGVSHSYISQLESGKRGIPSPEILKKFSKPLGIDYVELMEKAGYLEEVKLLKGMMGGELKARIPDKIDLQDKFVIDDLPIYMGDKELTPEMKRKLIDLAQLVFGTNDNSPKKN
jgi:transcriptional regulator with XRE-family HTH domain